LLFLICGLGKLLREGSFSLHDALCFILSSNSISLSLCLFGFLFGQKGCSGISFSLRLGLKLKLHLSLLLSLLNQLLLFFGLDICESNLSGLLVENYLVLHLLLVESLGSFWISI
jgi:hypothetical protein